MVTHDTGAQRPMHVPTQFATAIYAGRLLRRYTVLELEQKSGVAAWRIRRFEAAAARPSPAEFAALWNALSSEDD